MPPEQRPTFDAHGQQLGEQHNTVAGGNIYQGADPGQAFDLLRYIWEIDQGRTRRDDELAYELREGRKALADLVREFDAYQRFVASGFAAQSQQIAQALARLAALEAAHRTDRLIAFLALVVALVALGVAMAALRIAL